MSRRPPTRRRSGRAHGPRPRIARAHASLAHPIGTPVGSRAAVASTAIGYYVNMVTIESDVADASSFAEALRRLSFAAFDALANADVPYSRVVAATAGPQRGVSHSPLFNVVFVLQPPSETICSGGLRATIAERFNGSAKFDLLVQLEPQEGGFAVTFEHRTTVVGIDEVRAIAAEFDRALDAAVSERLPAAMEPDQTLHGWFDRIAARTPHAVAVSGEDGELTYAELQQRSERVARALVAGGIEPVRWSAS